MKSHVLEKSLRYDGSQLRSLFAYSQFGVLGTSVVAFVGACDVREHMVDVEDVIAGSLIQGKEMLHFIFEIFEGDSLIHGVSFQRLVTASAMEVMMKMNPSLSSRLHRDGDDLFLDQDKKMSISIATKSPVSTLIHWAINLTNEGTPVKTACLSDAGIDFKVFLQKLIDLVTQEHASIVTATQKVHWVK